jgi:hypothetical protein
MPRLFFEVVLALTKTFLIRIQRCSVRPKMSNKIALVSLDFAGTGSMCGGNKGVGGDAVDANVELPDPKGRAADDIDWNSLFDVVLIPNPRLSPAQRRTIELDYGMTEGRSIVRVRHALLYYFDKRLRLDVAEKQDRPKETPVVIENREPYDRVLEAVAY